MSEYQYVGFRAIDAPVSDQNLEYMERQSSRAKITKWSFDNEYHYGDFGGDAEEMLRRGYDIHLCYANYGVRRLMIRLPNGFPDSAAVQPYLVPDRLVYQKDPQGPGGILCITPWYEGGTLDDLWDLDSLLDELVGLRAEILGGDLRPLYLAHLAVMCDSEGGYGLDDEEEEDEYLGGYEGPVPAGLAAPTEAQQSLMDLFELSTELVEVAAQGAPSLPDAIDPAEQYAAWVKKQPAARRNAWLTELMADPHATVRATMLAEFHNSGARSAWPVALLKRRIGQLEEKAADLTRELEQKAAAVKAAKAARDRAKKLKAMAASPEKTFRQAEQLIDQRSSVSYNAAAELLASLREALAKTPQAGLAEQYALQLHQKHPTFRLLTAALRNQGLLPEQ
ncbi:MAG: hypothetical protein KDA79_13135 [Planctomycetaceae bacterium]|nr:hypothetical protein [Planctomycetaceae bacterium]